MSESCPLCVDVTSYMDDGWFNTWFDRLLAMVTIWLLAFVAFALSIHPANGLLRIEDTQQTSVAILAVTAFTFLIAGPNFIRRSIIGTSLYFFRVGDERHVHKHNYGIDANDARRRVLGGATSYLRLQLGGIKNCSGVFSAGSAASEKWVRCPGLRIRARALKLMKVTFSHPAAGSYAVDGIDPWDLLKIVRAVGFDVPSKFEFLLNRIELLGEDKAKKQLRPELEGLRRDANDKIEAINCLRAMLDERQHQLVLLIQTALQQRGRNESKAAKSLRELAEDFLLERLSADEKEMLLYGLEYREIEGVEDATAQHLIDLIKSQAPAQPAAAEPTAPSH